MEILILKTAYDNLLSTLIRNGHSVEAAELIAFDPAPSNRWTTINKGDKGRFTEERPEIKPGATKKPYEDKPGSVSPILQMSRIIDMMEKSPSFKNLPPQVIQGIQKVKKLTSNAFKYASEEGAEKDAFFGGEKDSLKELKKLLVKFDNMGPDPRKVTPEVIQAVDNLNMAVDKAIEARPKEKGILERGTDLAKGVAEKGVNLAKGVAEKGKDIAQGVADKGMGFAKGVVEKGQQIKQNFQDKAEKAKEEVKVNNERQVSSLKSLKDSLAKYPTYGKIYYRLPLEVRNVLEGIGLGIEDLNNVATAKVACHINNTLLNYLQSKKAYSENTPKEAMDFSGIGNLITPDKKLDDREISRAIRLAIAAELDAVHLYELIVDSSDDSDLKKVLQSISDEEKVHAGELQELLKKFDKDDEKFLEDGKKEVQDIV